MHFAFDNWLARRYPGCPFERFADDAVVHCKTKRQAEEVLAAIAAHADRRGDHEYTSFTFLGFTFRQRKARRKNGELFMSFLPAMSTDALKAKGERLRELRIHRQTTLSLGDLAAWLNPIVRGWMNYYGRFYRSVMAPLLMRVSTYLRRWAGKKYRRLRSHGRFRRWWTGLLDRQPDLFVHWRWVRSYSYSTAG